MQKLHFIFPCYLTERPTLSPISTAHTIQCSCMFPGPHLSAIPIPDAPFQGTIIRRSVLGRPCYVRQNKLEAVLYMVQI